MYKLKLYKANILVAHRILYFRYLESVTDNYYCYVYILLGFVAHFDIGSLKVHWEKCSWFYDHHRCQGVSITVDKHMYLIKKWISEIYCIVCTLMCFSCQCVLILQCCYCLINCWVVYPNYWLVSNVLSFINVCVFCRL